MFYNENESIVCDQCHKKQSALDIIYELEMCSLEEKENVMGENYLNIICEKCFNNIKSINFDIENYSHIFDKFDDIRLEKNCKSSDPYFEICDCCKQSRNSYHSYLVKKWTLITEKMCSELSIEERFSRYKVKIIFTTCIRCLSKFKKEPRLDNILHKQIDKFTFEYF